MPAMEAAKAPERLLFEARVEGKRDGRKELNPAEGWMAWIEDEVLFSGYDTRWDRKECGLSGLSPRLSEILCRGNNDIGVPAGREALCFPADNSEILRYVDFGEDEVCRQGTIVDENFEGGERCCLRRVND
jgi:hypothetical protein